jgi:hypothetical protein
MPQMRSDLGGCPRLGAPHAGHGKLGRHKHLQAAAALLQQLLAERATSLNFFCVASILLQSCRTCSSLLPCCFLSASTEARPAQPASTQILLAATDDAADGQHTTQSQRQDTINSPFQPTASLPRGNSPRHRGCDSTCFAASLLACTALRHLVP